MWSQAENVVTKMKKHPGFLLPFSIGVSSHYAHYKFLFQFVTWVVSCQKELVQVHLCQF